MDYKLVRLDLAQSITTFESPKIERWRIFLFFANHKSPHKAKISAKVLVPLPTPIVIHMKGTSPSECRHPSCWHTKGHIWIEVCPGYPRWVAYDTFLFHPAGYFAILPMLSFIRDSLYRKLTHHSWVSFTASRESLYLRIHSHEGCSTTYPRMCILTFKNNNTR